MRTVNLNDTKIDMPSNWGEVTLGMLMQIEQGDSSNVIFLLSVLTGTEYTVAEHSQMLEDEVYKAVRFIYDDTPKWQLLKVPKQLVINGRACRLPAISKVTLGQNIMMHNLLERPLVETLVSILALYFQPVYDNSRFDRDRLPEIEQLISRVPAVEGWAVANFFLRHSINLKRITKQGYIQMKRTQ